MKNIDDSKLSAVERIGMVGFCTIAIPCMVTVCSIQIPVLAASMCLSPIPGTVEYIATGKYKNTLKTLNNIADADRIIINNFLEPNAKIRYRNIFWYEG